MKTKLQSYPEEQAYLFGVTAPALGASPKGSEGERCEQSHACREITPIAIYLREQMCQARKSNITQRGHNKRLT
jgi:hypothetical protein